MQLLDGVEAVARLRITKANTRKCREPEVAERVGKLTALAAVGTLQIFAFAHNQCSRMGLICTQQCSDILRVVLTVAVKRYCVCKAVIQGISESGLQGVALTGVLGKFDNRRCSVERAEQSYGVVGASVAHDNHILALM